MKLLDSSSREERFTCTSSWEMMEEKEDKGSTDVEPRVIVEGRSSERTGEDAEGDFTECLMDDDR